MLESSRVLKSKLRKLGCYDYPNLKLESINGKVGEDIYVTFIKKNEDFEYGVFKFNSCCQTYASYMSLPSRIAKRFMPC